MIEDPSPSSVRTKVAKERVPGREATDQHLDQVLDLDTRAIVMLAIAKAAAADAEVSKVAVVAEGTNAAAGEAVVDEVAGTTSQAETRTPHLQHRLLKIRSPRQHLRLRLQSPQAVRLDSSRFESISAEYGAQNDRISFGASTAHRRNVVAMF